MRRVLLLLSTMFFFTVSCNRPEAGGLLPAGRMVDLLAEVHLLDGYLNTLPFDSSRRVIDGLYERLFEKYGIDSVSFRENVSHYLGNPIVSKELYVDVTKKLKEFDRQLHVEDSLRTAFVTDSARRANHYRKLWEETRKLLFEQPADTLPYDHFAAFWKMMDALNIPVRKPETGPPEPMRPKEKTPLLPDRSVSIESD